MSEVADAMARNEKIMIRMATDAIQDCVDFHTGGMVKVEGEAAYNSVYTLLTYLLDRRPTEEEVESIVQHR